MPIRTGYEKLTTEDLDSQVSGQRTDSSSEAAVVIPPPPPSLKLPPRDCDTDLSSDECLGADISEQAQLPQPELVRVTDLPSRHEMMALPLDVLQSIAEDAGVSVGELDTAAKAHRPKIKTICGLLDEQ